MNSQVFVLCFVVQALVRALPKTSEKPSFRVVPDVIRSNSPFLKLFCTVKHVTISEHFRFLGIMKIDGTQNEYIATIDENNTLYKKDSNDEVQGQLDNELGGYLLCQINIPKRSKKGQYRCVSETVLNGKANKHHSSSYYVGFKNTTENMGNLEDNVSKEILEFMARKLGKDVEKAKLNANSSVLFDNHLKEIRGNKNDGNSSVAETKSLNEDIIGLYEFLFNKDDVLILRHVSESPSFDKTFQEYENGFGNLKGNYWIGLEELYLFTKNPKTLHISIKHQDGTKVKFSYRNFRVENAESGYKLTVDGFYGNSQVFDLLSYNNGSEFSTKDKDNDYNKDLNCAQRYKAGWWYGKILKYSQKSVCTLLNSVGLHLNKNKISTNERNFKQTWTRIPFIQFVIAKD